MIDNGLGFQFVPGHPRSSANKATGEPLRRPRQCRAELWTQTLWDQLIFTLFVVLAFLWVADRVDRLHHEPGALRGYPCG